MSRKYKFHDQGLPYFVSFATVQWIDLFTRPTYTEILLDSLRFCQTHKGLRIYAWCIMTNHVHLVIGTNKNPMPDILRDFKSFTSNQLRKAIEENAQESRKKWILWMMQRAGLENGNNNNWQLWQQNNHPLELNSNKKIENSLDYIHMNPVKAGFVSEPHHWKYSSAINYSGGIGLIDIELIQ